MVQAEIFNIQIDRYSELETLDQRLHYSASLAKSASRERSPRARVM